MGKRKRSSRVQEIVEEEPPQKKDKSHLPPLERLSDEVYKKKGAWVNKQRVLVFCSRGLGAKERHFMNDLQNMLPHSKTEPKHDTKSDLKVINEVAEIRNCNKVIYFENRKHQDTFMWISDVTKGPSVKFHVVNIYTMGEMKLSGNSLKGSRPLLKFDTNFNKPHWAVIRELFVQIFGTPNQHPKSQPFFDHVITFTIIDGKIWFRNYQILEEDAELAEIGPRFVLNPIKIFDGSFKGISLWENPAYKTPSSMRSFTKMLSNDKFHTKDQQQRKRKARADMHPHKRRSEFVAIDHQQQQQ
uniref:Ribosome biogenesis protein BRX1 homolog n=1 Tax=Hirondellea gigas TaxID=1518452 RepID=A0A2P2HWB0_9CRUS